MPFYIAPLLHTFAHLLHPAIPENCENITFEGLVFKYDVPTSLSGIITEKTSNTITVQITDGSQITGQEYVTIINSFTNDGIVNKKF